MNARRLLVSAICLMLLAAGCANPPPATPVEPTAPPFVSATPDVSATSPRRTQEAVVTATPRPATATPARTATAIRTPTTARPTATATDTPPATPVAGQFIRSFEASPAEIDPGDEVTLTWEAEGDEATLYRLAATGQFGEFWDVPLSGSMTVQTDERDRNAVRYMLFVRQGEALENAMVSVTVRCTGDWFFQPAPETCPLDPALETSAAYQPFERGHMFWLGARARIYVLYAEGGSRSYSVLQDPWAPGMPESDPSITPPGGYVQPVRGFGMVWRGEVEPYLNVRERLGWGLQPEAGYTAQFQCDSPPKYVTCYLSGPGGNVWVLEPEGSGWHILAGATLR